MSARGPFRMGRPRDAELTRRLLDGALLLVAEDGFHRLNSDVLSASVGAGKAGLYRRWPDMTVLLADAISQLTLVQAVTPTNALRSDLIALLSPWLRPLDVGERAVAGLLGPSRHLAVLDAAVRTAVTVPLTVALDEFVDRHAARGHQVSPGQRRLLIGVVQALWWDRYLTHKPPSTAAEVDHLVDRVLLPLTL